MQAALSWDNLLIGPPFVEPSIEPSALLDDCPCIKTQSGGAPDVSGPSEPRSLNGALTGNVGPLDILDNLDATQPSGLDTPEPPINDPLPPFELSPSNVKDLDLWLQNNIHLCDLRLTADFVKALQQSTLGDPRLGLSSETLTCLCNPPHGQPCHVIDNNTCIVIKLYLGNPLKATYEMNCAIILDHFPDMDLLLYYKAKQLVANLTSVESVVHHMCINLCITYTGPFLELDTCPMYSKPQYD